MNKSRQAAWWQAEVVRRSSSAVDEAVDELTEKSRFFLKRSPRSPIHNNLPTSSSSNHSSSYSCDGTPESPTSQTRLDSMSEEWPSTPTTSSTPLQEQQSCHCNNDNDNDNDDQIEEEMPTIATFRRDEIQVGKLLGEGTFSCVYEVTGFVLDDDDDNNNENEDADETDVVKARRRHLRQDLASAEPGTFALKHLKAALLTNGTKDFGDAAIDLAMEAQFLAALDHPGILKCRGLPLHGVAAFAHSSSCHSDGVRHYGDGYFLVTDRLQETLAQRIERWQQQQDHNNSNDPTNCVLTKTRYAFQIADALRYLHEQRLVFRDLKPSNIGFKQSDPNQIQIFDFGLCRELPNQNRARPYRYRPYHPPTTIVGPSPHQVQEQHSNNNNNNNNNEVEEHEYDDEYSADMSMEEMDESWTEFSENDPEHQALEVPLPLPQQETRLHPRPLHHHPHPHRDAAEEPCREEVYFMSGAGTQIYMAVEVLLNSRYNCKADVYSWAMTFTEMLLLDKPMPCYDDLKDHIQFVCKEGDRPFLEDHDEIPQAIQELLEWAWEGNVSQRCSMAQVCDELQDILMHMQAIEDGEDVPAESSLSSSSGVVVALVVQTAARVKNFVMSTLERALRGLVSFFRMSRNATTTTSSLEEDEAAVDLLVVSSSSPTTTTTTNGAGAYPSTDKEDSSPGGDSPTKDLLPSNNSHRHDPALSSSASAAAFRASSHSSLDDGAPQVPLGPPSTCSNANATHRGSSMATRSAKAVLERLTSSTSTTTMTDDECDEDDPFHYHSSSSLLEVVAERQQQGGLLLQHQ